MATTKTTKPENDSPENKSENKVQEMTKTAPNTRWVKNAFFNGGVTKYIRLDEIHNELNENVAGQGDTTDEELAAEILRRAGLLEHPKYSEILQGLTDFFESIPDPAMEWVNPNYGKHFPKAVKAK